MKIRVNLLLYLISFLTFDTLTAQIAPSIEWAKCFGGSSLEWAYSVQQTIDSGFVIAGYTNSNDSDVSGNHLNSIGDPSKDCWIIKLNSNGNLVWQKCLGGSVGEWAYSVKQTTDSGYIVAGIAQSNDGDVSGNHSTQDCWIVKLNTQGDTIWQKCLGGSEPDAGYSVLQTIDGGYIVAANSKSNDGDVSGNHLNGIGETTWDYWIVRLGIAGNIIWQESLGGSDDEKPNFIMQTEDSGFLVAGYSYSEDDDLTANFGSRDCWIIRLDVLGGIIWQKNLGGSGSDEAFSAVQTSDSGFIVLASTISNDSDVTGNHLNIDSFPTYDVWIFKLDANGNLVWQRCFGGSATDTQYSIEESNDGNFIVAGGSFSTDGDLSVLNNNGESDWWVMKIDSIGDIIWQKTLGGTDQEGAYSVQQTNDGGYILAGSTWSNDSDVVGNHGKDDYWVVKLSSDIATGTDHLAQHLLSLYPNPAKNHLSINLPFPANSTTIRVFDLQGRIISLPINYTNSQAQMNTANLDGGFYTLEVINNKTGEKEVGKFVKAN